MLLTRPKKTIWKLAGLEFVVERKYDQIKELFTISIYNSNLDPC